MPVTRPSIRSTGFTLVELMVTLALLVLVAMQAVPSIGQAVTVARERSVVQKFVQDYDWLRSRAGSATVALTFNADCSWSATINGAADADHSMTAAALGSTAPSFACSGGTLALPVTFTFTRQGFVSPNGTLVLTGASGQGWPLQVLYSGSIVRRTGAS